MYKICASLIFLSVLSFKSYAQDKPDLFGKGLKVEGKDSSYYLVMGFRFQNLYVADWTVNDNGSLSGYNAAFLVRRARLKFDGWALSPRLTYKFELGLSNRDISGGLSDEFRNTSNVILDAWLAWNFYEHFSIQFGQGKLPGNRERLISSGNLQFVDRSRLNSRFTLDRGAGIQLKHYTRLGGAFLVREIFSLSQGDGRNVTEGFVGGFSYTFKLELLPFGEFASKGDYVGGAIKRETSPKLALGVSYDIDDNAVRERGHLGTFITDDEGNYYGHTLNTFCADLMFKYLGFSLMGEYAIRDTESHNPVVFDKAGNEIGTYYTGSGVNVQAGYMFDSNWELAARYTALFPDMEVAENEDVYTIAISKYIVGHKLKVQTDFSYFDRATSLDSFMWRTQAEFHF